MKVKKAVSGGGRVLMYALIMVVTLEKRQKTTVLGGQRPPAPFGTSRRPLGTTIHHSGGIGATFDVFTFSLAWISRDYELLRQR